MGQSTRTLRGWRGRAMAYVPQQPGLALHPLIRVGRQVENVLKSHNIYSGGSRAGILSLFEQVGLSEKCYSRYPHELSGGQLQRAAIVQALICRPRFLIADEPFAALDTVTRGEILKLLGEVKQAFGLSLLLISHDRQVAAAIADRILVLKDGRTSELLPGVPRAE
jgi:ABC-type dipeptide/oligopeptide/nickel transport system ATPase component